MAGQQDQDGVVHQESQNRSLYVSSLIFDSMMIKFVTFSGKSIAEGATIRELALGCHSITPLAIFPYLNLVADTLCKLLVALKNMRHFLLTVLFHHRVSIRGVFGISDNPSHLIWSFI